MKKFNKIYSVRKEILEVFFRLLLCFSFILFFICFLIPCYITVNVSFYLCSVGLIYFFFLSIVKGYNKNLLKNMIIVDTKNNIYFLINNNILMISIVLFLVFISLIIKFSNIEYIDNYKNITFYGKYSFCAFSLNLLFVLFIFRDYLIYKRIKKYSKDFSSLISKRSLLYKVYEVKVLKMDKNVFFVKYNNKVRKVIINTNYFDYKGLKNYFKMNIRA